jgi:hypothetical protein
MALNDAQRKTLEALIEADASFPSRRYSQWFVCAKGHVIRVAKASTMRLLKEMGYVVFTGSSVKGLEITDLGRGLLAKG